MTSLLQILCKNKNKLAKLIPTVLLILVIGGCKTLTLKIDKDNLIQRLSTMDTTIKCKTIPNFLGGGGSETTCHNSLKYFICYDLNGKIDSLNTENYRNLTAKLRNGKKKYINVSASIIKKNKISCIDAHKYYFKPIVIDSIESIAIKIHKRDYLKSKLH